MQNVRCPGRGAACFTLLRSAGAYRPPAGLRTPDQQRAPRRKGGALRSIRARHLGEPLNC